jgi:hypothetical protein
LPDKIRSNLFYAGRAGERSLRRLRRWEVEMTAILQREKVSPRNGDRSAPKSIGGGALQKPQQKMEELFVAYRVSSRVAASAVKTKHVSCKDDPKKSF